MKYIIEKDTSLLEALSGFFPDSSRRTLQNWIKAGRIAIDGAVQQRANSPVLAGKSLTLLSKAQGRTIEGIPLLYQDRWSIVIDKPSGLLSVPAENDQVSALDFLRIGMRCQSIYPVHRIDQETSGVLLFARGKQAEAAFDELFAAHLLDREYCAIVEGHLSSSQGTWVSFLKEKENYDVECVAEGEGKKAITHYEVLRRSPKFSFLRLRLETGRKHQIRVQCREAGHPILGDWRYGSTADPVKRLCLHAHALRFLHPFTQKQMAFTAVLPEGFKTLNFPLS